MTKMPRRYDSYNLYRNRCRSSCPKYQSYGSVGVTLTTQSSNHRRLFDRRRNNSMFCCMHNFREESYAKAFMRNMEAFYQSCAAYNLRYCPATGFTKHNGNYFRHVAQDVAVLICFLATNFIVFIAIVAKIIVHMVLVLLTTKQWISRMFSTRPDMLKKDFFSSSSAQLYRKYYSLQRPWDKNSVHYPLATYRLYQ